MVVVVVVCEGNRGGGRARHRAHRVVGGVGLERVRLALGHRDVHGRQRLCPGQQGLIQTGEYVTLKLQKDTHKKKSRQGEEGVSWNKLSEKNEKRKKARIKKTSQLIRLATHNGVEIDSRRGKS